MKLSIPLLHWFEQRQSNPCHRQLLVISGERSWAETTTKFLLNQQNIENPLWVGTHQADCDSINIKDFRTKLGHEYDWVILDCFSGFRASAAMALSGTIKAQGIMILICPDLGDWPSYADPEQQNRISYGFKHTLLTSRFIQYLSSFLHSHPAVAMLTQAEFSAEISYATCDDEQKRYIEQNHAVAAICKVAQGRNNRPLVLTADRGRGKSSALGMAAAQLMQSSPHTIWVTAPQIRNVDQVFSHNLGLLPEARCDKNQVKFESSTLAFKPLDVLLQSQDLPDILMVDEASAIPVDILLKLSQKFTRIVFSATLHGYEGSGRGFEIKFKQALLKIKPNYKSLHLSQPIRWYSEDALEKCWFEALFYQSKTANTLPCEIETLGPVAYKLVDQLSLLSDEKLLADVFSLLLDAHYQTSPDDLQRLLDSPEIKCFVITQADRVIGVAQIIEEGGRYLQPIAQQIAANAKRVKGHLVAQNIAASYNQAEFCAAKQWRISRIAVKTSQQRMGYATALLHYIESLAQQQNVSFLTVAFGASPSLLPLWHQLGYQAVKISLKPEVSSGEHSCIHIKPLAQEFTRITQAITLEFFNDLFFYMDKDLQSLSAEVLLEILLHANNQITMPNKAMVRQFINNNRNLNTCKRVLVFALLSHLHQIKHLASDEQSFLIALLLQNASYPEVTKIYGLTGKKQIEQKARYLFSLIF